MQAVSAATQADPEWGRLLKPPSALLARPGHASTAEWEVRVLGLAVRAAANAERGCVQLPHTFILRCALVFSTCQVGRSKMKHDAGPQLVRQLRAALRRAHCRPRPIARFARRKATESTAAPTAQPRRGPHFRDRQPHVDVGRECGPARPLGPASQPPKGSCGDRLNDSQGCRRRPSARPQRRFAPDPSSQCLKSSRFGEQHGVWTGLRIIISVRVKFLS